MLARQADDDKRVAELISEGRSAIKLSYADGGMNIHFRNILNSRGVDALQALASPKVPVSQPTRPAPIRFVPERSQPKHAHFDDGAKACVDRRRCGDYRRRPNLLYAVPRLSARCPAGGNGKGYAGAETLGGLFTLTNHKGESISEKTFLGRPCSYSSALLTALTSARPH